MCVWGRRLVKYQPDRLDGAASATLTAVRVGALQPERNECQCVEGCACHHHSLARPSAPPYRRSFGPLEVISMRIGLLRRAADGPGGKAAPR
jgi:hypothetical protein